MSYVEAVDVEKASHTSKLQPHMTISDKSMMIKGKIEIYFKEKNVIHNTLYLKFTLSVSVAGSKE